MKWKVVFSRVGAAATLRLNVEGISRGGGRDGDGVDRRRHDESRKPKFCRKCRKQQAESSSQIVQGRALGVKHRREIETEPGTKGKGSEAVPQLHEEKGKDVR